MSAAGHGAAKVILLGEHAVVSGAPALLAGLPDGMTAKVGGPASRLTVEISPWGVSAFAGHGTGLGRALTAIDATLAEAGLDEAARHRECFLSATVPPRAGFGSSAALAVALIRALAEAADRPDLTGAQAVASLAGASEAVFHGQASGADAAISAHGGFGRFTTAEGFTPLTPGATLGLVVADAGPRPPTHEMVARVQEKVERFDSARAAFAALARLSREGAAALETGDLAALGVHMNDAQEQLATLDLSTRAIDGHVKAARDAGALGAKLTGAGGGGAVVALCTPDTLDAVAAALAPRSDFSRAYRLEPTAPDHD